MGKKLRNAKDSRGLAIEPVRQLLKLLRPNYRSFVIAIVGIVGGTVAQLVGLGLVVPVLNGLVARSPEDVLKHFPFLKSLLATFGINASAGNLLILVIALIFLASILENLLLFLGRVNSMIFSQDIVCALRQRSFERLLGFSKGFYVRENPGKLNTLLITTSADVGRFMDGLTSFGVAIVFASGFFLVMVVISWKLTLFASGLLALLNKISKSMVRRSHSNAASSQNSLFQLSAQSSDVLANMPLVQISGMEGFEKERFCRYSQAIRQHQISLGKKLYFTPAIVEIVNLGGIIILVGVSFYLYFSTNSYSTGGLLVYFVCLRRFTGQVRQAIDAWIRCEALFPAIEKSLWLFEEKGKISISGGTRPFEGIQHEITFKNVTFTYEDDAQLLKDLTFTVPRGSMLAIVGPTGSGKTSLVNLIPRFYEYTSGSIEVDGINIREFELSSYRRRIAVVSQDLLVLNDSIGSNLIYGLDKSKITEEMISSTLKKAFLFDFVERQPEKLNTLVGDNGLRLSGGERQRLSIARAMLSEPDILILDEATSALDSETEVMVQKGIDQLIGDRTIFVIAHRLSTIKNADKIIVLESGEIVEQGTPEELFSKQGRFYQFSALQNLVQEQEAKTF